MLNEIGRKISRVMFVCAAVMVSSPSLHTKMAG